MSIQCKETNTIEKLIKKESLTIPDYQRSYKWQWEIIANNDKTKKGHVQKLLDDILEHQNKNISRYRIGTIVIHEENGSLNIVDGQQRITTLVLLLLALEKKEIKFLEKLKYDHKISKQNIYKNYHGIQNFAKNLKDKKEAFKKFLLEKCEVVYIVVDSIDEAFQFFDSQNSRGKYLAAYDLLKAFHLRAMKDETLYKVSEKEKIDLVKQWEDASKHRFLKIIFDYLYAIRKWLRGEYTSKTKRWDNGDFIKDDVEEFKGIVFERYNYPYLKTINAPDTHFAIDRAIFNGSLFFKMILHYVVLYKKIFNYRKDENGDYKDYFLKSLEKNNIKDMKIVNKKREGREEYLTISHIFTKGGARFTFTEILFKRIYLFYCDRFGDNDSEKAIKVCFEWAGEPLGEKIRLVYRAIQEHANKNNSLLKRIKYAVRHTEITNK